MSIDTFHKIILSVLIVMVLSLVGSVTYLYVYSQQYVQHTATTATKGILFKTTLNLGEYRNVSSGNGWLGTFDRYSRSDRHTEALTVYCKDFCKE